MSVLGGARPAACGSALAREVTQADVGIPYRVTARPPSTSISQRWGCGVCGRGRTSPEWVLLSQGSGYTPHISADRCRLSNARHRHLSRPARPLAEYPGWHRDIPDLRPMSGRYLTVPAGVTGSCALICRHGVGASRSRLPDGGAPGLGCYWLPARAGTGRIGWRRSGAARHAWSYYGQRCPGMCQPREASDIPTGAERSFDSFVGGLQIAARLLCVLHRYSLWWWQKLFGHVCDVSLLLHTNWQIECSYISNSASQFADHFLSVRKRYPLSFSS